jgi:hypothetical protein
MSSSCESIDSVIDMTELYYYTHESSPVILYTLPLLNCWKHKIKKTAPKMICIIS